MLPQPPETSFHHPQQLLVYQPDHLPASVVTTVLKAATMAPKGSPLLQVSRQTELHLVLHRRQALECLECLLVFLLPRQVCLQACPRTPTRDDELALKELVGFIYGSRKKLLFLARRYMGMLGILVAW